MLIVAMWKKHNSFCFVLPRGWHGNIKMTRNYAFNTTDYHSQRKCCVACYSHGHGHPHHKKQTVSQLLLTVSQTEYLQKTWLLVHYKYTTKGVLVQKCLSYLSDRKLCSRILPEEKHFKSRFVSFCCGHSILL